MGSVGAASRSRKGKEKESESGSGSGSRPVSHRRREPSDTSVDTARADSSAGGSEVASVTPSTPPSTSSGNSYSAELHDLLTPLRDASAPSTSKRRSVPTMGPVFEPPQLTTPLPGPTATSPGGGPYQYQAGHVVTANHALASATRLAGSPSMGLSEILATPSYREINASRNSEYTTSPFEPSNPSPNSRDVGREIDYFNLPMSYRDGSLSAHHTPESSQSRRSGSGTSPGHDPPRPQSEPLPEDPSTPSWSSSDITSLTQSSSLRSPRIRNEGMLAPHGSFTSDSGRQYQAQAKLRRAESLSKESASSGDSVQSWRSRTASERSTDATGRRQVSEIQYRQYVKDAMNGDQLALYHLGWAPNKAHDRHSLGDAELVWGGAVEPTSPGAFSSRSSATSRPSIRSNSSLARSQSGRAGPQEDATRDARSRQGSHEGTGERPPIRSRQSTYESDLFSDVARMTLQSNAKNNRAGQATPPPTPGATDAPPRPNPPPTLRRTSTKDRLETRALSGMNDSKREKDRSSRPKDPLLDKERDPVREQERKEERERRRAARTASSRKAGDTNSSASGSTLRTKGD